MLDYLEQLFITFFNMTVTGSYIIIAIILIRLLLRKAPKIFSYCLWLVAGLRLICPFSFSSVLSVFNFLSVPANESAVSSLTVNGYIPDNIGMMNVPEISTGINAADSVINPVLPVPQIGNSINPMQVITAAASVLWVIGIIAMAVYGVVSLVKIKKRTEFATKLEGNIFECDKIRSPFVSGVFKPRIYLPCRMDEKQREYVVLHEKNHIRRFDHITKLLSFAVLTLHWYNPFVWVAYNLMVRDMEMSCDERVLRELGDAEKKNYGLTLVAIGANRRFGAAAPLSFGENVVKKRIVNVLNFKKPETAAIIVCAVLCVTVGAVCLTNSVNKTYDKEDIREKVEIFLEEDWQKQTEGNDHYKYEMRIAAAEVIEISEDKKTAYGWQRLYDYNSSYYQLLRYEDVLFWNVSMLAVGFKAELDEKGNVVSVTNYENDKDIPESVRQKGRFDNEIFERAQNKARGKYKEYLSLVKTYETEYSYTADESIDAVKITGCELVTDHFGKPCLVIRAKNTAKGGAYYLLDDFDLLNGKTGEAYAPKHPAALFETTIPSGDLIGTEVLHFADLSMYIDEISEPSYVLRLIVSDNDGIRKEMMLEIKVGKATSKRPQLTYENLSFGELVPITEEIKGAVSGVIYPGMNYNNFINLSAEELEKIVECINKTKFTRVREAYIDSSKSIYVVIDTADNKKYKFSIFESGLNDEAKGDFYECNSYDLYSILEKITYSHGMTFQPDYVTGEGEKGGYTETTTAPQIIMPDIHTTVVQGSEMHNSPTPEVTSSVNMPSEYTRHVVSDIETNFPDELELDLVGVDIQNSDYVYATFINRSDKIIYIVPNQAMRKQVDGEWKRMTIDVLYEPLLDYYPIYPNTLSTVSFPFGPYFPGIEEHHGRYSLSTGYYYGTKEGADENSGGIISFQFTVDVRKVSGAETGEKITDPDMVLSTPASTGVYNMKTRFSDEERKKIVELYNGFDWSTPGSEQLYGDVQSEPNDVAYFSYGLTVIDGDREIFLIVDHRGIIEMNGQYYDVGSGGKQLYDLIAVPW